MRKAPHLVLLAQVGQMKVAIADGRARAVASSLKELERNAAASGLRHLAVECSLLVAESLLATKSHAEALKELENALRQSERLGMQMLTARSHALLARTYRATNKAADASNHATRAQQILDDVRKEAAPADPLKRADLKALVSPQ
jgi:hypothetical protein